MKWLVIAVGFFLPALVLLFNAHTMKEQIEAVFGWLLGGLLVYIFRNQESSNVKWWLDRF